MAQRHYCSKCFGTGEHRAPASEQGDECRPGWVLCSCRLGRLLAIRRQSRRDDAAADRYADEIFGFGES